MGFGEWQMLAALAAGLDSRPLNLPANIRARCDGKTVILESLPS
jgi:hypothetical protein